MVSKPPPQHWSHTWNLESASGVWGLRPSGSSPGFVSKPPHSIWSLGSGIISGNTALGGVSSQSIRKVCGFGFVVCGGVLLMSCIVYLHIHIYIYGQADLPVVMCSSLWVKETPDHHNSRCQFAPQASYCERSKWFEGSMSACLLKFWWSGVKWWASFHPQLRWAQAQGSTQRIKTLCQKRVAEAPAVLARTWKPLRGQWV